MLKAFGNESSANITFSKTQLPKMIQSGELLTDIINVISSLDNFFKFPFKVINSYWNEISNINNKKIYKNNDKNLLIHAILNVIGEKD